MSTRSAYSLSRSLASRTLKKLNKLFRVNRGPWASSKFGKQLAESRRLLVQGLKNGSIQTDVVESWLPGVARDQQRAMQSFTLNDLIGVLERKTGQIVSKKSFPVEQGFLAFHSVFLRATSQAEKLIRVISTQRTHV